MNVFMAMLVSLLLLGHASAQSLSPTGTSVVAQPVIFPMCNAMRGAHISVYSFLH